MKKIVIIFAAILMMGVSATESYAQLSDEEYNYVTMDLRGILNLTMTTNPQVDFTFKTIQEYRNGITRFNATLLEVDATLAWDLFVYASKDKWEQVEAYSTNGNAYLPAEILEIESSVDNVAPVNINDFTSLLGKTASAVVDGVPTAATQYLAGQFGTVAANDATYAFAPGTAADLPAFNKFRINMRLKPGVPAIFPNSSVLLTANGNNEAYAQAGYYYLEVVYTLIEDL